MIRKAKPRKRRSRVTRLQTTQLEIMRLAGARLINERIDRAILAGIDEWERQQLLAEIGDIF